MNSYLRLCMIALLVMPATQTHAAEANNPREDQQLAVELKKRYDKGDGDAALRIGNLLAQNRIPAAQYGQPVDWYKKGCKLHDVAACHNVGLAYQKGSYGLQRDLAEAAEYYVRAANRGFLNSMYNLAILYANAEANAADPREGLKWMLVAQKAAAQCPDRKLCKIVTEDQAGYRTRLEARLSSKERREAYKLAENWRTIN